MSNVSRGASWNKLTQFSVLFFCSIFYLKTICTEEIQGIPLASSVAVEETTDQIMARPVQQTPLHEYPLPARPHKVVPTINIDLLPKTISICDETYVCPYRSPQTVDSPNFTSVTLADTLSLPPDSDGAIGPSQYLTVVNGRIRSHLKSTGAADGVLNTSLDSFFNSVRNGIRTTDPRVKYDRITGRWFVICINVDQPGPNRLLLAVSSNAILSGSTIWRFFFLDHSAVNPPGDTGLFFDFCTLGIDNNALYSGGNLFNSSNFYVNSTALVIQKTSALGTGPLVATAFRNLVAGGGPVTPQGVQNFDTSATQGFFVGPVNNNFLALRIVSNPGSISPTMSGAIFLSIPTIAEPLDVPSLGSASPLDSVDTRLAEAHVRNNQLWLIHNIGVNTTGTSTGSITRTGSRWYQFNITNPLAPTLIQSGTLFDSAVSNPTFYWMPSIMTSGQEHAALGFSVAGATQFANAGTVGRLANAPLNSLGTPVLYTASSTSYNVQSGGSQRWGDYSVTSLDPQDNMTMWTIQEFCNATNSYGCQVVKLLAPPPANVSSATPPLVPQGSSSVTVRINGSSINGSGFYDPGADFEKRIIALISGGVIVNSITYVSPTVVMLDINTSFASKGTKQVIIRNPDSQQKVGSVLIVN